MVIPGSDQTPELPGGGEIGVPRKCREVRMELPNPLCSKSAVLRWENLEKGDPAERRVFGSFLNLKHSQSLSTGFEAKGDFRRSPPVLLQAREGKKKKVLNRSL